MWQRGPEQRQRSAKRQGDGAGKLSDHPALVFVYRLACELGEPDIDKLLDGLPAKKLVGWMDYYELEPFGYARMDLGTPSLQVSSPMPTGAAGNGRSRCLISYRNSGRTRSRTGEI